MKPRKTHPSFTPSEQRLVESEVQKILKSLPYPILGEDDLQSYAYIGLLEAQKRFNPSYNVPFSTYARYRVRGAMLDGIRKSSQYGRTGYSTLKSWIQYEINQPQSGGDKLQQSSKDIERRSDSRERQDPVDQATYIDSYSLNDQVGITHFKTLQKMATHLWIENMISLPSDEPEYNLEKTEQKSRLSLAFSELNSSDQELMIALYDLKRCGDNAKQYAVRVGVHRSSIYRRHERIITWLRKRVIELSGSETDKMI